MIGRKETEINEIANIVRKDATPSDGSKIGTRGFIRGRRKEE